MTYRFFGLEALLQNIALRLDPTLPTVASLIRTAAIFRARARQRQQLYTLSDYQLKDMGITKADALNEANKPFWQE